MFSTHNIIYRDYCAIAEALCVQSEDEIAPRIVRLTKSPNLEVCLHLDHMLLGSRTIPIPTTQKTFWYELSHVWLLSHGLDPRKYETK